MVRAPYHVVHRLFAIAETNWAVIDGEAVMGNVNLMAMPVDRFCNAILYWAVQRVEKPQEFLDTLREPPQNKRSPQTVSADEVKAELDAFAGLMAATSG